MEAHRVTLHPCPFCNKETIEALTWPGHTGASSSRSAGAKATTFHKVAGGFEMISKKCSNCGKTASEIRKAWKDGVPLDKDAKRKRLEQLKNLGFSGVIGSK